MIKKMYNKLTMPALSCYYIWKYRGIWGIKSILSQSPIPNARLLAIYEAYFSRYGSWVGYNSQFANVPCFPHGLHGIFISGSVKCGRNTVIFQHVTIGSNTLNNSEKSGSPTLGNNVFIGAGAKIIGKITIGDNCRIGANAVVYQDMPSNSVAVQSPTRIIQKSNLDNRYYSQKKGGGWVYFSDGDWIEDNDKKI